MALTHPPAPLDASTAAAADGAKRPLGRIAGKRDDGFQVVYTRDALDIITRHGNSRTDVEVGGVLLGSLCHDDAGVYLLVDHAIPALTANEHVANVTFTGDTWAEIHEKIDAQRPGSQIVGWYHTHPRFGVFLSSMDVFIQRSFFDGPHMVALVFDPVAADIGTFVWRGDEPTGEPSLTEIEPFIEPPTTAQPPAARSPELAPPPAAVSLERPLPKPTKRRREARSFVPPAPPTTLTPAATEPASARKKPRRKLPPVVNDTLDTIGRMQPKQFAALTALLFLATFLLLCLALIALDRPPRLGTSPTSSDVNNK